MKRIIGLLFSTFVTVASAGTPLASSTGSYPAMTVGTAVALSGTQVGNVIVSGSGGTITLASGTSTVTLTGSGALLVPLVTGSAVVSGSSLYSGTAGYALQSGTLYTPTLAPAWIASITGLAVLTAPGFNVTSADAMHFVPDELWLDYSDGSHFDYSAFNSSVGGGPDFVANLADGSNLQLQDGGMLVTDTTGKTLTFWNGELSINGGSGSLDGVLSGTCITSGTIAAACLPIGTGTGTVLSGTTFIPSSSSLPSFWFATPMKGESPATLNLAYSLDGLTWNALGNSTWADPRGGSYLVHDPTWLIDGQTVYVSYNNHGPTYPWNTFSVTSSTDFVNWTAPYNVPCASASTYLTGLNSLNLSGTVTQVFSPVFFRDTDSSIHIIVGIGASVDGNKMRLFETHPVSTIASGSWSAPVPLIGPNSGSLNPALIHTANGYELYFNDLYDNYHVNHWVAPTLTGTYVNRGSWDWLGLDVTPGPAYGYHECSGVVVLSSTSRRLFFEANSSNSVDGMWYCDFSDASGVFTGSNCTVLSVAPITGGLTLRQGGYGPISNINFAPLLPSPTGTNGLLVESGSFRAMAASTAVIAGGTFTGTVNPSGQVTLPNATSIAFTGIGSVSVGSIRSTGNTLVLRPPNDSGNTLVLSGNTITATNEYLQLGFYGSVNGSTSLMLNNSGTLIQFGSGYSTGNLGSISAGGWTLPSGAVITIGATPGWTGTANGFSVIGGIITGTR